MKKLIRKIRAVVFLLLGIIVLFTAYTVFFSKAEIYGLEQFEKLPRSKEISLRVSDNVNYLSIYILQEGKEKLIFSGEPKKGRELSLVLKPEEYELKEGKAKLRVELKRLGFLKETIEKDILIDTQPPRVNIIHSSYAVRQGGSGALRVSVSEEARLKVKVGEREYGFYPVGDRVFISIFPVSVDTPAGSYIYIVAQDDAGNTSRLNTGIKVKPSKFKEYSIRLDGREDRILEKLSEILGREVSKDDFVNAFREVNEKVREENERKIRKVASESLSKKLWSGRFLQLKNSKVVSLFGEKRKYYYKNKFISSSWHWGYDLASIKNAPVEASNSGVVVFAGYIGIYGNTVIIDHGYGVMSLYAHLAEFKVKEGQEVKKGQTIGITDMTGLAFGDHLHFGILVQGVEVNPIEWWDPKWVSKNIDKAF